MPTHIERSHIVNLPDFDYHTPTSQKDALDLLLELGADAALTAGGTDLIPNMKNGTIRPKALISLKNLPAEKERLTQDGSLRLDALSTLAEIAESPLIKAQAPSLAAAAFQVAGQQIRNRASLGGNLCQETRCLYLNQSHGFQFVAPCYKRDGDCCYPYPAGKRRCRSVFMSDMAPVLMTLGAQLVIVDRSGGRRTDINDFYTGDGLRPLNLAPAEMITAIVIPPQFQKMQCHFVKATPRGGLEFAMVSVAVALEIDAQDKNCTQAFIAVGSINTSPLRAFAAEQALAGHKLDEALAVDIARAVAGEVKVLPHHGYSQRYLKQLVNVHVKRSLMALMNPP